MIIKCGIINLNNQRKKCKRKEKKMLEKLKMHEEGKKMQRGHQLSL